MSSNAAPRRVLPVVLYGLALSTIAALFVLGFDFYRTPLLERGHHPGYWTWKAGGTVGHTLGLVGSAMMVLMLLYSVRKRVGALRRVGPLSRWLDVHIFLGVVGPAAGDPPQQLQGAGPRGPQLLVDDRGRLERRPRPLPLPADPADPGRGGPGARGPRAAGPRALGAAPHPLRPRRGAARGARRRDGDRVRPRGPPRGDAPDRRGRPAAPRRGCARSPGAVPRCPGRSWASSDGRCGRRPSRAAASSCGAACTSSSTTGTCSTSPSPWSCTSSCSSTWRWRSGPATGGRGCR